jgi:hypothetical protein
MIKGIPVRLINQIPAGENPLGEPVTVPEWAVVENVLPGQPTMEQIVTDQQLFGKRTVYLLCIPKGDAHHWEDAEVLFFGRKFRTFGPCIEYVEANCPTPWNRQIRCELIE